MSYIKADDSILVIGAGFVRLATATFLATKGYKTSVVEMNPFIIDSLNKGKLHFRESALSIKLKLAVSKGLLKVVAPMV